MKDLTLHLKNKPGSLADIGELLGTAGVNIEGLCGFPVEDKFVVHMLVKEVDVVRKTLLNVKIDIEAEREVVVFSKAEKEIVGKPGSFGEICRQFASAGITIDLAYAAEDNKFVFGVDDITKAKGILE